MSDFHIGVSYLDGTPNDAVTEFAASIDRPGLTLRVERQEITPRASIQWLAPTVVVVYVAKSYFDGFLSEVGKEHYLALKRGIEALGKRLLGRSGPRAVLISASGKRSSGERFSIALSVEAQIGDHRSVKLLLPKRVSNTELSDAVEAFMSLLLENDALLSVVREYDLLTAACNPVLVWFNPGTRLMEVVNLGPTGHKRKA